MLYAVDDTAPQVDLTADLMLGRLAWHGRRIDRRDAKIADALDGVWADV